MMSDGTPAQTLRLFTGLPVSETLNAQCSRLPYQGLDARWHHPQDRHLTLRFLGDIESENVDDIARALGKVRQRPFGLEIDGLSCFLKPDRKWGTIVYANVASTRKLAALVTEITDALEPLGFDFKGRHYIPHITLARVRNAHNVQAYCDANGPLIRTSWLVDTFHLYVSGRKQAQGRRYSPLFSYPLL